MDDYPEEVLDMVENGTGVTTLDGQKVSGITVKNYASLNEAPKDLQDKLARAKITPTGAFQVFCRMTTKPFMTSMFKLEYL